MADKFNSPGNYGVEISGWGLDGGFFAEKTELIWSPSGDKRILLRRTLSEGAMLFVRLLGSQSVKCSVPIAYQVSGVFPMDCEGRCEAHLQQLHPRLKAPNAGVTASYMCEDSLDAHEPREGSIQLEPEEVLQ